MENNTNSIKPMILKCNAFFGGSLGNEGVAARNYKKKKMHNLIKFLCKYFHQ